MSNSNKVFNTSFLSGSHFVFKIDGFPNLEFNIQEANLPSIQSNPKTISTPAGNMAVSGEHVDYDVLKLGFICSETLNEWRELYAWIRAFSPTSVLPETGNAPENQYNTWQETHGDLYRSATLMVLTNSLHINITVTFYNLFPYSLSGIPFSTKDTDDRKIISTAMFGYTHYDLEVNPIYNTNGYVADNKI